PREHRPAARPDHADAVRHSRADGHRHHGYDRPPVQPRLGARSRNGRRSVLARDRSGAVSDRGLLSRFDALRRQSPSRPLVHLPGMGATWSASDVWNAHLEIAEALRGHGVSAGHLVVSAAGNAPDSVPLLLACRALGVALMPVDAGAPRVEIDALA